MEEKFKLSLEGLDCANCANKIEQKVNQLAEVEEAILNFSIGRMEVRVSEGFKKIDVKDKIIEIVKALEPDVVVSEYSSRSKDIKLNLAGLDCSNCANKIEKKVNELDAVNQARVNFSMGNMTFTLNDNYKKEDVIKSITQIVNTLEPDVIVSEYDRFHKGNAAAHNHDHSHCKDGTCSIESDELHSSKLQIFVKENIQIILGIIIYILAMIFKDIKVAGLCLFLLSYVLVGGKIVLTALRNIGKGEIFDENFLMSVATIGALIIGEYPEAVAVMIFYEIGEMFQSYAVNTSRKSITSLMNVRADYANLLTSDGEKKVSPEDVEIGEIILIKPGERVPLDGIIIEGNGSLDTSALTGESMPRDVLNGEEILSGSINLNSLLKVKVTKIFGESTISRILEMVENAGSKKAPTEKFITKFCRYYTPAVVFSALAVAIIPPLVVKDSSFSMWIYRALSFLVVSCPCALVVSIPLGLFSGIGGASKKGILVKGGNYLEALKDVSTVVFDKTGTLTKGSFKVSEINCNDNISEGELLKYAAIGESFSNHPIAKSIVNEYGKDINKDDIKNYQELSGHGVMADILGRSTLIGNYKLMKKYDIECNEAEASGTTVYVAIDKRYAGSIVISDEVKDDSKEAIKELKKLNIKNIVMLTGDNKKAAHKVADDLGIDKVFSELLPIDKVDKVEKLISNKKNEKLIFVGDGINDAPVLARADIGAAMGGIGSDAAIEAADIVLMKDSVSSLVDAIKIARKTNRILWQNIIFSLVVKIGVLILITAGLANMWEAVFADVGVTLIAVVNSMRALK